MIKVSGKFVSVLLGFLQKHMDEHDFSVLQHFHGNYYIYNHDNLILYTI